MEITTINQTGFKIKGKKITVVSDPVGKTLVLSGADREDFVLPGPGEYEVGGVDIFGAVDIYRVVVEDVSICFLASKVGDHEIGNVDILLISTAVDAETVAKLEPVIVVPVGPKEEIEKFVKELGHEGIAAQPKLVVSKDKLPETMTVIVLG